MRRVLDGWESARDVAHGWQPGCTGTGDDADWFFRLVFEADQDGEVVFGGVATLASVSLDSEPVAESQSMWVPVRVPVAAGVHELLVHCHALTPRLAERRRPRARWRQKVAYDGNLRWFRTTLLGRAPGFAPGPPVVGLWRPVWFEAGESRLTLRTRLDGDDGVITAVADRTGTLRAGGVALELQAGVAGELRLGGIERWWPHTHGEPALYDVEFEGLRRRVGFRGLSAPGDVLRDGLSIHVNGVPIFVRGALWTPVPGGEERATLEHARDAGLNCIRLPGTGVYESAAFHDLCDELGMLVWQDAMFANLDYPFADAGFRALVDAELDALLDIVGGRPSLAVVCGNSEIEQQVAMLGLDPALGREDFFGEQLPARLSAAGVDALYLPSAPCGADRPLRPDDGVASWFGVGGYRRPLADARAAGVRFASECLAIANVPGDAPADHRAGVMRDVDSPWDFADVRDHYLAELYGVDPGALCDADPERYLDLSRAVSGDVMAEVLGEWRRAGSACAGALILWLRDLAPGAGWGLLDHRGAPKAVLGALGRVLAPVAVWTTDEGMGGIAVHVANDGPLPLSARVRVALYSDGEHGVGEASTPIEVAPHSGWTGDVETLLGRWVDAAYAYRFGPPAHDLVVAALEGPGGEPIAQAERFPLGRVHVARGAAELGLEGEIVDDTARLVARRAVVGVRLSGCSCREDGFLLEPGVERRVKLRDVRAPRLHARNLDAPLELG